MLVIDDFQPNFTIEYAIISLATAWNQIHAGILTKAWGRLYPVSSAPDVKEEENESGVQNIFETTWFPTKYNVLQSLNANKIEMWMQQVEEITEQYSEESNSHKISNNDSSHLNESNINGQEHSNEEISLE